MARAVTQFQWPSGMLELEERADHVFRTLARVYALWSRALSSSKSSRCCFERSFAFIPATIVKQEQSL